MTGDLLLDTSVAVEVLRGDKLMAEKLRARQVYLPATALGELLYGASRSRRPLDDSAAVTMFAASVTVLPITADTAAAYAHVRRRLQLAGKPIPENDIWIAASAMEHGLVVATRDEHFRAIEQLQIELW